MYPKSDSSSKCLNFIKPRKENITLGKVYERLISSFKNTRAFGISRNKHAHGKPAVINEKTENVNIIG